MKWYKHLFIYLGCIAFTELVLAGIYLLVQICDGYNAWHIFAWQQIGVPIVAFVLFLLMEALISFEAESEAQAQWYKRVNKMLEEHEKENLKEIKEVIEKYKEDIEDE